MSSRFAYPLDPKANENPLQYLKRSDWKINYSIFSNVKDFHSTYEFNKVLVNKPEYKVIKIRHRTENSGYEIVKIYDTNNKLDSFYKEIVFIHATALIEYYQIYYHPKTKKCYIRQPMYSKSLGLQINNCNYDMLNNERKVKFMISDIFMK
eukprot:22991_1